MKDKLKKNIIFKKIVYFIRKFEYLFTFIEDYIYFIKNYSNANDSFGKEKYKMLLLVHSIEKGMTNSKPRIFGESKIDELIMYLNKYASDEYSNEFEVIESYNILRSYKKYYKDNNLPFPKIISKIDEFLKKHNNIKKINLDSIKYKINDTNIDYDNFISSKHSTRKYNDTKLDDEVVEKCSKIAIKSPSACNRQMCKIYYIGSSKKSYVIDIVHGFGNFDLDNANIFIITFDMSSFTFAGERNQGYLNCGIFATNFTNALHSFGIGSCMLQFANSYKEEKKLKKKLNIPKNEKIALVISAGYYKEETIIPKSIRRELVDFYKKVI